MTTPYISCLPFGLDYNIIIVVAHPLHNMIIVGTHILTYTPQLTLLCTIIIIIIILRNSPRYNNNKIV